MRKKLNFSGCGLLIISVVAAMGGSPAQATTLEWTLSNVFDDGPGQATGFFVYDTSQNRYTNWSIQVTAGGSFTPFLYTPSTSTADPCCEDAIQLTSNDLSRTFELDYSSAADSSDSPQSAGGFELGSGSVRHVSIDSNAAIVFSAPVTPIRLPTGVPEPGSMSMLAGAGLALLTWRRMSGAAS